MAGLHIFIEKHRINSIIIEREISSVMVVTDRDEDSISKIRRRINDLFENISYRAGEWINNEIKDSFGQPKTNRYISLNCTNG